MLPIHTELLREVYSGQSLSKLNEVNATIQGRKFHTDTHILYDIRTILGNQEPRNYLEIGAYVGSSASLMLSHPYSTNVSSIDPMFLPHSHQNVDIPQEELFRMNTNHFIRDDNNLTLWKTFSHTCPLVVQYHSEPNQEAQKPWVDILFIDGDHSATAVKNDWALYSPLIRPGGFVVFDDYMDFQYSPEVHGAVDEIVATLDTTKWYVIGSPPHNPDEPEGSSFNEFVIYRRP